MIKSAMTNFNCLICGTEGKARKTVHKDTHGKKIYRLYGCRCCLLEWWEPREIIPLLYEDEILPGYEWVHRQTSSQLFQNHKAFFRLFPYKTGTLLDVGCSSGSFLEYSKRLGFDGWGVDFDPKAIEVARNKGLKNVYTMSLDDFSNFMKTKRLQFNVVTFFDVLEHQDEPKEFIKTVRGLLLRGGYIAGSVPNSNRALKNLVELALRQVSPD